MAHHKSMTSHKQVVMLHDLLCVAMRASTFGGIKVERNLRLCDAACLMRLTCSMRASDTLVKRILIAIACGIH